jgi:hypothetical protein
MSALHQALNGSLSPRELTPWRRYFPQSQTAYQASVLTMWNVLDTLIKAQNFGCVDKSPLSHPTSACTGKSDRFNPYSFGYLRPVQMLAHARHIHRLAGAATYCEVGMNGGHGAVAALLANPALVVHAFDLLEWHYSPTVAAFLNQSFPGRFHCHGGAMTHMHASPRAGGDTLARSPAMLLCARCS